MHRSALALLLVLPLGCAPQDAAPPAEDAPPTMSAEEEAAWSVIEGLATQFADPSAALEAGYMRDPTGACVTADMAGLPAADGAMGVHYLHPDRLGMVEGSEPMHGTDGVVNWAEPEILVYEPQADGSEALVAVEYFVFQEPWEAAGNASGPAFFGTPFIAVPESGGRFTPYYELHVWFPRDNPSGRFIDFNPAVSCAHAGMSSM